MWHPRFFERCCKLVRLQPNNSSLVTTLIRLCDFLGWSSSRPAKREINDFRAITGRFSFVWQRPNFALISVSGLKAAQMSTIRDFIRTRSSHFAVFTPLTRSHRALDSSPMKAGNRMAGNILLARAGASNRARLLIK